MIRFRDRTCCSIGRGLTIAALGLPLLASAAVASDWPQLQRDAGHTGYSPDRPAPPFRVKWTRSLGEPTHTGAPPIVAGGKVIVGTNWGNVLALDRGTGKTVWAYKTGGPVCGTPALVGGLVYANSMDRRCHAIAAADGKGVWTFETGAGIWAAPVVAGGKVFVAGRDGVAYALDARSGKAVWQTPVGGMVLATPACAGGVLYVGGGDNCVHALDAKTGRRIWRSAKLPGMAIRDYWLVAAEGLVFCTTQLVYGAHSTYIQIEKAIMRPFRQANEGKMLVQADLLKKIRQWYVEHPHQKTFHVLDAKTGREKFVAPIIPVHGGGSAGPLPVIAPGGVAHVMFTNVRLTASGWAFAGRLDLETGDVDPLIKGRYRVSDKHWEWQAAPGKKLTRHSTFASGFCVNDQSWGLSRAGDLLLAVRDPGWAASEGARSYIDLTTGRDGWVTADRTRVREAVWGGRFGGACHATASPIVVSGRQLFHKAVRNVIVCFEGGAR